MGDYMQNKWIKEIKAKLDGVEIPVQCINMSVEYAEEFVNYYHYHDYVEILYGIDCDLEVWSNGKLYNLKTGDMLVINSGYAHNVRCVSKTGNYIVIKFLPQILYAAEQSIFEFKYVFPFVSYGETLKKHFKNDELINTEIPYAMKDILNEWNKKNYGFEIALRIYVMKIVLWLVRMWNVTDDGDFNNFSESDTGYRIIQKALEYIRENYSEVNATDVASHCGLSYSYFSRIFKKIMHKSFNEYLNYVRLTEAERLLAGTELEITEIALETGFSSTSYFIDKFKKQFGVTPKQFRIKYKNI